MYRTINNPKTTLGFGIGHPQRRNVVVDCVLGCLGIRRCRVPLDTQGIQPKQVPASQRESINENGRSLCRQVFVESFFSRRYFRSSS